MIGGRGNIGAAFYDHIFHLFKGMISLMGSDIGYEAQRPWLGSSLCSEMEIRLSELQEVLYCAYRSVNII